MKSLTHSPIDLRSDTVTLPTPRMLEAMRNAALGDDGLDRDPTVQDLEERAAAMLGKEAGLFVTSGTMGNLVASLTHAVDGGEALVDPDAHIMRSEGGGISRLAGLTCIQVPSTAGEMDLGALQSLLRQHGLKAGRPAAMAVVETSHNHSGGRVPSIAYMTELYALAAAAGVPVHIDGARIFNAAVALGVDVASLAACGDSVTFCLSKGLSAPIGSVLTGSRGFVERARLFRRMVGGGLRQAGCVAAAGIVALEEMIPRLEDDHRHARMLWSQLRRVSPLLAGSAPPDTNILMLDLRAIVRRRDAADWVAELARCGVLVRARDANVLRLVTHRHIGQDEVQAAAVALRGCLLS